VHRAHDRSRLPRLHALRLGRVREGPQDGAGRPPRGCHRSGGPAAAALPVTWVPRAGSELCRSQAAPARPPPLGRCDPRARHTELGLEREIRLWRYGHELGWAAAVERRPPDGRLVFGFVGRVAPEKGVHVLLDAASRLDPGAGGAAVEVWGDAAQEPGYLARCRALPTTGLAVDFRGRFTRDRLAEVYGHIDVLVVPSTWNENDPLVVHEAFAAGVPVIASDVGGLREVVTAESDGLLFRAGDAGDLAAAMARFVTDPTLVSRLRAGIGLGRTSSEAAADLAALYAGLVEGLAG